MDLRDLFKTTNIVRKSNFYFKWRSFQRLGPAIENPDCRMILCWCSPLAGNKRQREIKEKFTWTEQTRGSWSQSHPLACLRKKCKNLLVILVIYQNNLVWYLINLQKWNANLPLVALCYKSIKKETDRFSVIL